MAEDIVPKLLDEIKATFEMSRTSDDIIMEKLAVLDLGKATYADAHEYAIRIGEKLAEVFEGQISSDILPDGKMYYNIAERILNDTLKENHNLITAYTSEVQQILNDSANIRIRPQVPKVSQHRIDGIINRLASEEVFDDVKWILREPIVTFSQSVVDDMIHENLDFHAKAGLKPKIERVVHGHKPCEWCLNLAGSYTYPDVPNDVYRRHDRCRCTTTYNPVDGKRVNVWTKR